METNIPSLLGLQQLIHFCDRLRENGTPKTGNSHFGLPLVSLRLPAGGLRAKKKNEEEAKERPIDNSRLCGNYGKNEQHSARENETHAHRELEVVVCDTQL